ncbi:hypothetical protein [Yoonia sp. I 8.24]|uniref:hypothetical protein n=1 Tax=Yoonia sp. I 8.24 TaxID=1537229 RepID=UPI001EE1377F|nr:hypothetical protein [Yoonia sp. I 8.24]MCG3268340.1 hypothetical protein [Yoonia sp. I 8.24]
MTRQERKYTAAAALLFASAALHLPIAGIDFGAFGIQMIVAALLWTVLGLGLLRYWRWCAYIALFGMLYGVSAALFGAMDAIGLVSILFWAIVAIDALAAAILFGLLWAPHPKRPT